MCYLHIFRIGQNHTHTVYIRHFWQEDLQIYNLIRCIYTVLANPTLVSYVSHAHMALRQLCYAPP